MLSIVQDVLTRLYAFLGGDIYYINSGEALPPPLSREEEAKIMEQLRAGDEDVKQTLIERNLRLVVYIARKFENTGVCVEDLISIGTIGLIKAVNTFDAEKRIKLATYASRCIENEILMHFRNIKKNASDVYLGDSLESDRDGNPLTLQDTISDNRDMAEDLEKKIRWEKAAEYLENLEDEREREIIILRYGLDNKKPLTQREVAARLNISRSYVSRIEKKVLSDMRKNIE